MRLFTSGVGGDAAFEARVCRVGGVIALSMTVTLAKVGSWDTFSSVVV
jgi:hypothetical protein